MNTAASVAVISTVNLKTTVSTLLEHELDAWRSGERRMNVSNQFDKTVLESALANLGSFEEAVSALTPGQCQAMSTMSWAHHLSSFEAPEIDSACVDLPPPPPESA
jgi:hypothetical protein